MGPAFGELVDLRLVKALMQQFYELTGLPSTLIDPSGDILRTDDGAMVGVGWRKICLDFHRAHPSTGASCRRSDVELCRAAIERGGGTYGCLNGLVDAAVPVTVDGEHVANLFTGQFLFDPPDEAAFAARAERFGFDRAAYLQALREVPVFSRDFVARGLAFLHRLAEVLGEMGMKEKRLRDLNAALARNCAEMEAARNAARAAGDSKGRLVAAVSHELRSPLQGLELYAWLLRNALARGEVQAASAHLDKLVRSCERMAQLVAMVLRHGDIAGDRVRLAPSLVDMKALVGDILAGAEDRARAKGLGLAASFAPGLRPLRTDPDLLRTVIANLVDNAIKFSETGRVTVDVAPEADGIRCTVADTGCGIAPADQHRVFEPFGQIEETVHKHSPGLGLGLPIARSTVDLLGGSIDLVSALGAGSAFSVLVPALAEETPCPQS